MSEPIAEHLTSRSPSGASDSAPAAFEPPWALLLGGAAGAACLFLFALLFGARWAIAVAAFAAVVALVRRVPTAAIAFVIAGALSAIGGAPRTSTLFIAALAFGVGLAIAAHAHARTHARVAAP